VSHPGRGYNIEVEFLGLTPTQQSVFESVATRDLLTRLIRMTIARVEVVGNWIR